MWTLWIVALFFAGEGASEIRPLGVEPFFRLRDHATTYVGPGRELPPPSGLRSIYLAYFGPPSASDPKAGTIWAGAQMALGECLPLEVEAQTLRLELLPTWTADPWTGGAGQLARSIYTQPVWAVIGGIDGETTHLAVQVAAKARIVIVSPGNTDKTTHLANVPWVFSILPGDDQLANLLGEEWRRRGLEREVVLLAAADHDSRVFAGELVNMLARIKGGVRYRADWKPGLPELVDLIQHVVQMNPRCLMIVAPAWEAARAIVLLRKEGYECPIFAGPTVGQQTFADLAGLDTGEVIFPLCWQWTEKTQAFVDGFFSRYNSFPDYLAAAGYDAVTICVEALRHAGLNRARINDALRELSPWEGVSGLIVWDKTGLNTRKPSLARWINGELQVMEEQERWKAFFNFLEKNQTP